MRDAKATKGRKTENAEIQFGAENYKNVRIYYTMKEKSSAKLKELQ